MKKLNNTINPLTAKRLKADTEDLQVLGKYHYLKAKYQSIINYLKDTSLSKELKQLYMELFKYYQLYLAIAEFTFSKKYNVNLKNGYIIDLNNSLLLVGEKNYVA